MNKDHIEILKHSGNYLIAVIASRALSFISIPVLTYLLTVGDYGVYNVFISTLQMATLLLTLNTEVAISRFYYEAKCENDFKRFVGTSICLSFAIFCLMTLFMMLFSNRLSNYLGLDRLLLVCIVPLAAYSVMDNIFQQIYQPQLKSRMIAILSSVSSYLGFFISVIYILLMNNKRYYGLVYGSITTSFLLGVYIVRQISKYSIICFDLKYLKYILSFTLPYLPYSLSSIIVIQFGKLIVGQQEGFDSAGLYSFAQNISGLMMVVIVVVHSAWNPYYMQYMNDANYTKIDGDYDIIWKATLIFGSFLSLFGLEIGTLLARPQYVSALYLIPILVMGYFFYQWSFVYLRNSAFTKKTIWNAVVVILSGIFNVVLNSILIRRFQLLGVAISFAMSYAVMLVLSWLANMLFLKAYVPNVMRFVVPFILYIPILALSCYWGMYVEVSIEMVSLKLITFIVFALLLSYNYYIKWLKNFLGRLRVL